MLGIVALSPFIIKSTIQEGYRFICSEMRYSYPNTQASTFTFLSAAILTTKLVIKIFSKQSVTIIDLVIVLGAWIGHRSTSHLTYMEITQNFSAVFKREDDKLQAHLLSDQEALSQLEAFYEKLKNLKKKIHDLIQQSTSFLQKIECNAKKREEWLQQIQEHQKRQEEFQNAKLEILQELQSDVKTTQDLEKETAQKYQKFVKS